MRALVILARGPGPMLFVVLAVSAVVPSLLIMWYFHARDVFREPPAALWSVFAGGVLIAFPVVVVAWPLSRLASLVEEPLAAGALGALLGAAIPEEGFKLLLLWWYAARRLEFDEPMDGVVYGVAASLGFATLENLLYVAGSGLGTAVTRALTAVPSHAFLGAIMGYYAGRARFAPQSERRRWLTRAFVVPTALHALYNFPLLAGREVGRVDPSSEPLLVSLLALVPLIVVAELIWAMRLSHGLRRVQDPMRTPRRWASVFLTVLGGVAASLGGLVAFALVMTLALGKPLPEQIGTLESGAVLLGLTPLAAGTALFAWGVKRLNEAGRRT